MPRRFCLLIVVMVLWYGLQHSLVQAQEMAGYYDDLFLAAPPASFEDGLLGFVNPALPSVADDNLRLVWTTDGRDLASIQSWGVFSSMGGLGTAVVRQRIGSLRTTGWHVSLAGGNRQFALGLGYQGYSGDATALGRYNRLTTGAVIRPSRYLSVGFIGNVSLETDDREAVAEVGVRPLGTPRLTLFADAAVADGQALVDAPWSAGAAVQLVDGVNVVGRYFESDAFSVGLRFDLGRAGVESQSRFTASGSYASQVNSVRLGSYVPNAIGAQLLADDRHLALRLSGPVPYRSTRVASWLSDSPTRFYELIRTLEQAAASPRIAAVALDLSGLQVTPEQAWEVRTALDGVQAAGKHLVVFLEEGGMTTYHLASVADRVVLDPQGTLILPGYVLSRTFLAGTLDKLGLGFQEWRFFEYKSAAEILARTGFSEADSLQRQQYVNDQYALTRRAILADRPLAADSLDRLIDEQVVLTAQMARDAALVDTLARWSDRDELLSDLTGTSTRAISADALDAIQTASRQWSEPPKVALVYGIGPTELTSGIEARALRDTFQRLADDDDVKAVVFRVDSPGGSALASDLVAEALRACAEKKPVIVSQGQVAASGGYWISMYADSIVAGPNTVTGSIGVIGGWIYDNGFSDKTGLSYDSVQRGERADLFSGLSLPGLGAQLPTRPLTDDELARIENVFRQLYSEFVAKVAAGRDTTEAHIRAIGEGRIYSGIEGQQVGLVDRIGGLAMALSMARDAAGLTGERVEIVETNPTTGFFNLRGALPMPFLGGEKAAAASALADDPVAQFVQLLLDHQPRPLVVLPPDGYPAAQE
jgi:protease-4